MFDLTSRSLLPRTVELVFETVFRRRSALASVPTITFKVSKPLRFGRFHFFVSSSEPRRAVLEISSDLSTWEPARELFIKNEMQFEDSRAADEDRGFYRLRCGEIVSDVYGFYKVQTSPGYSLLGYPFEPLGSSLQDILHWMPTGAELTRFDPMMMKLRKSSFQTKWSDPAVLKNAEGFLFFNPTGTTFPIVVSGIVRNGSQRMALQAGTGLRSSMLPMEGDIEKDLHVPFEPGETLTLFYSDRQEYVEFKWTENGWMDAPPKIRLGEGFWIGKKGASQWEQQWPDSAALPI